MFHGSVTPCSLMNSFVFSSVMNHWYLVQFKPNSHRLAERNLNRQGFVTFLPMQETTRRKVSRFVSNLKPVFPGYIFVSVKSDHAPWRKISSTIGVSRLVSFGDKPKPLPPQLISGLMFRCDKAGKILPLKKFNKGDRFELLSGPFANFIATLESIDQEQRIWVLIDFMGQRTRMKMASDQLKLAN